MIWCLSPATRDLPLVTRFTSKIFEGGGPGCAGPRALNLLADISLLDELLHIGCLVERLKIIVPKGHPAETPFPGANGRSGYTLVIPRLTLDNATRLHALAAPAYFEGVSGMADRVQWDIRARTNITLS